MNLDIKLHNEDLPDQLNLGDNISVDCEFMGLNVERDKLCLVQISTGKNDAHIIKLNRESYNAPNLKIILEDPSIKKVGQNIKLDFLILSTMSVDSILVLSGSLKLFLNFISS